MKEADFQVIIIWTMKNFMRHIGAKETTSDYQNLGWTGNNMEDFKLLGDSIDDTTFSLALADSKWWEIGCWSIIPYTTDRLLWRPRVRSLYGDENWDVEKFARSHGEPASSGRSDKRAM